MDVITTSKALTSTATLRQCNQKSLGQANSATSVMALKGLATCFQGTPDDVSPAGGLPCPLVRDKPRHSGGDRACIEHPLYLK